MEIVMIEKRAFMDFMASVEAFFDGMADISRRLTNREVSEWVDTADVCRELKLSKRTVQTLRSTGKLPYTRFNHKTYYKLEDVMKVLEEHKALARKDACRLNSASWRLVRVLLVSPFFASHVSGMQQMPVFTTAFFASMLIRQRTAVVPSAFTRRRSM